MAWFKQPDPEQAKRHFERRAQNKLAAGAHALLALLLAFQFSGCDGVHAKMMLFSWIMFGPLVLQLFLVLGESQLPYQIARLDLGRNLVFGLFMAFPFWLVGLGVMKVFA